MPGETHILVITGNENSGIVRSLLKHNSIPVIRRSIQSAIELMQHLKVAAVVIVRDHNNVDSLEFILNARDISVDIPIYVPAEFHEMKDWEIISKFSNVLVYDDEKQLLKMQVS